MCVLNFRPNRHHGKIGNRSPKEIVKWNMSALDAYYKHPLSQFLNARSLPKERSRYATMTGMGEINGRWEIKDDEYPMLLDLLHDYLFTKEKRALGFVEQPCLDAPKPILIDLDFRYKAEKALNHSFTMEHVKRFCRELRGALEYFFPFDEYERIRFFTLLRPQAYKDKEHVKDGIHVEIPDISLNNEKWKVIRKWLLHHGIVRSIFRDTGYINQDEDVYDEAMGRKQGWMFYGASKPSVPAYELAAVYTYLPKSQLWEEEPITNYSPRQLLELLSVRYNVVEDDNQIREEIRDEFDAIARSRKDSIHMPSSAEEPIPDDNTIKEALLAQLPKGAGLEEDKIVVRQMVERCLSAERADKYESWIRVGWCLHNISPTEDFFDLWMDFSKKSSKYIHNDMNQLCRDWFSGCWRKDGDGPRLTIRSLYLWARQDNPDVYNKIIDENISEYINTEVDATHFHIASLMKKMYGATFIASVGQRSTEWYMYDENLNMWKHLNQGMELKQRICLDVANRIQSARNKIRDRMVSSRNETERAQWETKFKQLWEMEKKLYSISFNEGVMKMSQQIFYEQDFVKKLNMDPFLVGCANGILELRHRQPTDTRDHVIFRQGRPEDYVSFLLGQNDGDTQPIRYIPYDANDPRQGEITDFFKKLFPREELRSYVLRLLASCLEGCNREQQFYFFIGVGSNGKSKLIELMRLTLGDYQASLATTALTRKRPESGAANPDIMATKCRHMITSQEPDDREPLNTSRMKQLSGEDMVEGRGLFQDQEKFKMMGKMFMMCNRLPPVFAMDNGTWRRIRVIPFESRFEPEDHPDLMAKKTNVYPRDDFLDTKLRDWREPFLSLLVHIYETEYIPFGLRPEPSIVKEESEKYKENFDSFAKFRNERFRELKNGFQELVGEHTEFNNIKKAYKTWMADQMGTAGKALGPKDLFNKCVDAFGAPADEKTFLHIRVFFQESDVEEFDKEHADLSS
jgi:P4 family phage/plasmid primase-like protien